MSNPSTDFVGVGSGKVTGAVFVADTTVAMPTDAVTTPTGFVCIGYTSDAGTEVSESSSTNSVTAWEGGIEIYNTISGFTEQVKFTPVEFNADALKLTYGDENVEWDEQNHTITVKHNGKTMKPKHMFIDMIERDDVVHRMCMKVQLTARDAATYDGKTPSGRRLTFNVLGDSNGDAITDLYARIS